ncbi:hypothetical protein TRFO_23919 [Tritrichomonas foetus]|uniref:Uncharacterized protein n=1 Tax=Tritrichomonas foetus TaxID=1144522 RepID=A0A1J4K8B8_9EUKA|nr:hypothetical protein TRFO_23919 [Tritrichomonas foetus]|eukprot:OHT07745.1 hypothetical protein TRFO_23919 [Tritrichomonas foetus]
MLFPAESLTNAEELVNVLKDPGIPVEIKNPSPEFLQFLTMNISSIIKIYLDNCQFQDKSFCANINSLITSHDSGIRIVFSTDEKLLDFIIEFPFILSTKNNITRGRYCKLLEQLFLMSDIEYLSHIENHKNGDGFLKNLVGNINYLSMFDFLINFITSNAYSTITFFEKCNFTQMLIDFLRDDKYANISEGVLRLLFYLTKSASKTSKLFLPLLAKENIDFIFSIGTKTAYDLISSVHCQSQQIPRSVVDQINHKLPELCHLLRSATVFSSTEVAALNLVGSIVNDLYGEVTACDAPTPVDFTPKKNMRLNDSVDLFMLKANKPSVSVFSQHTESESSHDMRNEEEEDDDEGPLMLSEFRRKKYSTRKAMNKGKEENERNNLQNNLNDSSQDEKEKNSNKTPFNMPLLNLNLRNNNSQLNQNSMQNAEIQNNENEKSDKIVKEKVNGLSAVSRITSSTGAIIHARSNPVIHSQHMSIIPTSMAKTRPSIPRIPPSQSQNFEKAKVTSIIEEEDEFQDLQPNTPSSNTISNPPLIQNNLPFSSSNTDTHTKKYGEENPEIHKIEEEENGGDLMELLASSDQKQQPSTPPPLRPRSRFVVNDIIYSPMSEISPLANNTQTGEKLSLLELARQPPLNPHLDLLFHHSSDKEEISSARSWSSSDANFNLSNSSNPNFLSNSSLGSNSSQNNALNHSLNNELSNVLNNGLDSGLDDRLKTSVEEDHLSLVQLANEAATPDYKPETSSTKPISRLSLPIDFKKNGFTLHSSGINKPSIPPHIQNQNYQNNSHLNSLGNNLNEPNSGGFNDLLQSSPTFFGSLSPRTGNPPTGSSLRLNSHAHSSNSSSGEMYSFYSTQPNYPNSARVVRPNSLFSRQCFAIEEDPTEDVSTTNTCRDDEEDEFNQTEEEEEEEEALQIENEEGKNEILNEIIEEENETNQSNSLNNKESPENQNEKNPNTDKNCLNCPILETPETNESKTKLKSNPTNHLNNHSNHSSGCHSNRIKTSKTSPKSCKNRKKLNDGNSEEDEEEKNSTLIVDIVCYMIEQFFYHPMNSFLHQSVRSIFDTLFEYSSLVEKILNQSKLPSKIVESEQQRKDGKIEACFWGHLHRFTEIIQYFPDTIPDEISKEWQDYISTVFEEDEKLMKSNFGGNFPELSQIFKDSKNRVLRPDL